MTPSCQNYIQGCIYRYPLQGDVLEVGSLDVCGNPRHNFSVKRFPTYTGIDMRPGNCVDKVMNCHDMSAFEGASFDVVVDAERLEHDNDFIASYREISRVLRPGGYVIITTRSWGGFAPHDYPSDYWRFLDNGLKHILETTGFKCLETEYGEYDDKKGHAAVFACGQKLPIPDKAYDMDALRELDFGPHERSLWGR